MSRENVEVVNQFLAGYLEADLAELVRNEEMVRAATDAAASLFHPDFESELVWPGRRETYQGLDGLRESWADWLSPWHSYRVEVDEVIDAGDRVLVLGRDYGRRKDLGQEVEIATASVWSFRDQRISRIAFYADRTQALEAAGLSE